VERVRDGLVIMMVAMNVAMKVVMMMVMVMVMMAVMMKSACARDVSMVAMRDW